MLHGLVLALGITTRKGNTVNREFFVLKYFVRGQAIRKYFKQNISTKKILSTTLHVRTYVETNNGRAA